MRDTPPTDPFHQEPAPLLVAVAPLASLRSAPSGGQQPLGHIPVFGKNTQLSCSIFLNKSVSPPIYPTGLGAYTTMTWEFHLTIGLHLHSADWRGCCPGRGGSMSRDAEYAQKQFHAEKAKSTKSEQVDSELRTLRNKVKALEEKVSSLSTELSTKRVIGENKRGFS